MEPVLQFQTELTLTPEVTGGKEATILFVTSDQATARNLITKQLGEEVRFDQQRDGAMFVYHPDILNGKDPCGWTHQLYVPPGYDVKHIVSAKLGIVPKRSAA